MNSIDGIKSGLKNKDANNVIARKVFLSYSTEIFQNDQDREFYIKDTIAKNFEIPFSSIEIAGSVEAPVKLTTSGRGKLTTSFAGEDF